MEKNSCTRREFLKAGAGAAAGVMTATVFGCSGGGGGSEPTTASSTADDWSYQGQHGITAVFETADSTLYRQLLPEQFEMPERLLVIVCVVSYDNVSHPLVPYLEGFVMLSCTYEGQESLYTVTMPVDDQTACDGGLYMGFPKYCHFDSVFSVAFRRTPVIWQRFIRGFISAWK